VTLTAYESVFWNSRGMALCRTLGSLRTTYPRDLTDAEWECVQCCHPPASTRGRPRIHSLHRILDTSYSLLRTRHVLVPIGTLGDISPYSASSFARFRDIPSGRRPVYRGPHLVVHMIDGFGGTQYANLGERL
jgi:hypothetical protein